MSEIGDGFRMLKEHDRLVRQKYGSPCPECVRRLPRAQPKILLPRQRCRMHDYVDPRPELTNDQWRGV